MYKIVARLTPECREDARLCSREDAQALRSAGVLAIANVVAFLGHLSGLILTILHSRSGLVMQSFFVVPRVTNATLEIQPCCSIDPREILIGIFAIACGFHLIQGVLLLGFVFGWAWLETLGRAYLAYLSRGLAPLRWLEFSFTSSLMVALVARLIGTLSIHEVWFASQTTAVAMLFYYAEEINAERYIVRFDDASLSEEERRAFRIADFELRLRWKPETLIARLQIHVLAWVPLVTVWALLFASYHESASALGPAFPDVLPAVTIVTFGFLFSFAIVQLVVQLLRRGPSLYWLIELIYIALSLAGKLTLGMLVVFRILGNGSRFDSMFFATEF